MNCSKESEQREPNPILKANFLSKWFFWWTKETFRKGYQQHFEATDLYAHIPGLDSRQVSEELIRHWEKEVRRKNPNLIHMIFRVYGCRFIPISILFSILEISVHTMQPLFLGGLVSYFSDARDDVSSTQAFLYASGIVLCSLLSTLFRHPFMFFLFETGTRIRISLSGLVYRKCLRASVTADNTGISGYAIAVLSSDLAKFDMTFRCFHELWKGPVECCIFGYIMYRVINWPGIVGLAAIILFTPLQAWTAKAAAHFRQSSAELADERVKMMHEIIMAIKVIKMYAWEKSFAKLIAAIRKKELRAIRGTMKVFAAIQCTELISKLSLFLSLIAYAYNGEIVTAQKVFIIFSYYNVLNESLLHAWPLAVTTWAETMVCARRVVQFLLQSEDPADGGIENICKEHVHKGNYSGHVHNPHAIKKSVLLEKLSASWDKVADNSKRRKHIQDINLNILNSQFVGIIGGVASGKTTLLNVILGELEVLVGNVEVNGTISYAPQEPWVFEASIRDNITFVESFDEERYKQVLNVCALERDIELLPFGDSTLVGERGISLSGGQKARICLARAVYRKADIYIFDDPLSAVDALAAKILMDNCMLEFLQDKIRILVTHRLQHLKHVDHLILMDSGRLDVQGSYDELKNLLRFRMHEELEAEVRLSLHRADSIVAQKDDAEVEEKTFVKDTGIERKEQLMKGSVKWQTYLAYFETLGLPWIVVIVSTLFILARVSQSGMEVFISRWATWEETIPMKYESHGEYSSKRIDMIFIYTVFIICTLTLYIARTFGFFLMCLHISLRLHKRLFDGVIRAYMSFFDNNPSGRILNRFSSDVENVDIELPQVMMESISFFLNAFSVLVIVAIANNWLLIPTTLIIFLLYLCRTLFIAVSRNLKRLEVITRSPVYSHISQTFQGLTTIRALNATSHLEHEFYDHLNTNTSALYILTSINRAFAFWSDLICVLYILVVTFSFLVVNRNYLSGDVGLAISQSLTLIIMIQWGMLQTAEMENNMTSVERIIEYAETTTEPQLVETLIPPLNWPHEGLISFKNVHLRYSEKGEYVLKGLNFSIRPMEKLGIVGRTGAGKTSIIQAIFRLAFIEGLIEIDGIDISTIGLHTLRSRISIIPQDPVLFSGTLRYNLDPFEEKSDEELWKALENVKLKEYVSSLEGGLGCCMHDGGINFSMGQRQLVCMARAILRHNKILLMDEPTANVDPDTDQLIQETIHTTFESCTVLTIAHRLHTVMDNDRVLVIDEGQVVELGHPHELLQKRDGFLYKLVARTGKWTAQGLRMMAEQSYKKRVTDKTSVDGSLQNRSSMNIKQN